MSSVPREYDFLLTDTYEGDAIARYRHLRALASLVAAASATATARARLDLALATGHPATRTYLNDIADAIRVELHAERTFDADLG